MAKPRVRTDKQREAERRYHHSPKGRERLKRYQMTAKYLKVVKPNYQTSPKGRMKSIERRQKNAEAKNRD